MGAAFAPQVAPVRRALAERVLRLRGSIGDPVAPFLDAPCHQMEDGATGDMDTRIATGPS